MKMFVFIDENEESIANGAITIASDAYGYMNEWCDLPSDRHNQECNLSFADGHVAVVHWKAPKVFKHYMQSTTGSADREDLYRLRNLTPPGK